MLDNLPDIHAPESGADDIYTPERLDNSPDIHTLEISSTCNDQEFILKKAKLIRNFGIASFSFVGIIILLYIICLIVALSSTQNYPNSSVAFSMSMVIIISILVIIFSIADFVFMILAIVNIATTDWGNENLNKCKKVFWITTLSCLIGGFIAWVLMVAGNFASSIALQIIGMLLSIPLGITQPIMWIIWGNKVKNTYSTNTKA